MRETNQAVRDLGLGPGPGSGHLEQALRKRSFLNGL